MSKRTHTPGPWKRNHLTVTAVSNGVHIADASPPNKAIRGAEREEEMEYCRANAQLMATAPELLQALQLVRMSAVWGGLAQESKELIEATIRKAVGAKK